MKIKKHLALLLALCLAVAPLASCDKGNTNTPDGTEAPTIAVTTPETDAPEDSSDEAEETTIEPETASPYSAGFYFTSYGDGTCVLAGRGECTDPELIIPPVSPEGDIITNIGARVFEFNTYITSVTVPDSIGFICQYAFHHSEALKTVTIDGYRATIGEHAFSACPVLTDITILDGVYFISSAAFSNCDVLTNVTISDSVKEIGARAFASCSSLETLVIGKGVTTIDGFAFAGNKKLATVYYAGSEEDWAAINIGYRNNDLTEATRYYYSETRPDVEGNYWHYVDGVPTKW